MTTSRTATLTMMAAVGLSPKKPVRWRSPPVRGDAAAESSLLSLLTLTSTLVSDDFASGAFGAASSAGFAGGVTLGAAEGADCWVVGLSWASAIGTAPAATRRAQSASAKV